MSSTRTSLGAQLSALGSALLLTSLWLPWYEITFPAAFRQMLGQLGGSAAAGGQPAPGIGGAINSLVAGLATAIPDKISGNGWEVMKAADVVLAVIVGLVLLLLTNGFGFVKVEAAGRGQAVAALGMVAIGIVGYHIISRPFGNLPGFMDKPTLRYGIGAALAGAALIAAGGYMLRGEDTARITAPAPRPFDAPDEPVTPVYTPPAGTTSIAPPTVG
jgi:hypothetical protein